MEKEVFLELIGNILSKYGFKKVGPNKWIWQSREISELVYMQKSRYGQIFYLHYYFIVNGINSDNFYEKAIPIFFVPPKEWHDLKILCNLENNIEDNERKKEAMSLFSDIISKIRGRINNDCEMKKLIKNNNIPLHKKIIEYYAL